MWKWCAGIVQSIIGSLYKLSNIYFTNSYRYQRFISLISNIYFFDIFYFTKCKTLFIHFYLDKRFKLFHIYLYNKIWSILSINLLLLLLFNWFKYTLYWIIWQRRQDILLILSRYTILISMFQLHNSAIMWNDCIIQLKNFKKWRIFEQLYCWQTLYNSCIDELFVIEFVLNLK